MTEPELLRARVETVRERLENACTKAGRSPAGVILCAASKTQTPATIAEAAKLPIDAFGENRVQELVANRAANAYGSTPLHFIGHLQTNKVKQIVGCTRLIQSVDSEKLLRAIDREASRQQLVQDILLEVNLAGEESKSGVSPDALPALAELCEQLCGVRVRGLMCVPPRTSDETAQHKAFEVLRHLSENLSGRGYARLQMEHLSMGMTGDFEAAIAEGSTIVRIGTAIFGPRNYKQGADFHQF